MLCCGRTTIATATIETSALALSSAAAAPKKVTVFGGTGYIGLVVCERLVKRGHDVTSVSRRGFNPRPGDEALDRVRWVAGDATDPKTVQDAVSEAEGVVHAMGVQFDPDAGMSRLDAIQSVSNSLPGKDSMYERITRQTISSVIDALEKKSSVPSLHGQPMTRVPVCFVSVAEAGWSEMTLGSAIEKYLFPDWLKRCLVANRATEAILRESANTGRIRPVIYRPSFVWDWSNCTVLPKVVVYNFASAMGVSLMDKTVRIETLADAIVAGIEDDSVEGVQRYKQMEELAERL